MCFSGSTETILLHTAQVFSVSNLLKLVPLKKQKIPGDRASVYLSFRQQHPNGRSILDEGGTVGNIAEAFTYPSPSKS